MAPFDYTPPANPHALHSPAEQAQGRTWVRYTVRPGDSLAKLAVQHRTTITALVQTNRITNPRAIKPGTVLQVPAGTAPARSTAPAPRAGTSVPPRKATSFKAPTRQLRTHVVRPGDNLIRLGVQYGCGWSAIMKANGLSDPNQISAGQTLRIPVQPGTAGPASTAAPVAHTSPAASRSAAPKPAATRTHTVRPGENLIGLGSRYGVGWRALMNANGMTDPNTVAVGTVLRVPAKGEHVTPAKPAPVKPAAPQPAPAKPVAHKGASAPAPTARKTTPVRITPRIHTVRAGDNLIALGSRYGVGWRALMNANRISDPSTVAVGTVLRIPAPGTAVAAPKPSAQPVAQKPAAKAAGKAKPVTRKAPAKKTSRSSSNTFLGRTYPDHVVASASKNREALRHVAVPSRSQTRDLIVQTARRYGVSPRLALAVGWQESGWNQRSVSVANAVGIMQVMPSTGQWCSDMVGHRLNLMDPRDNVTAGVVMLRWLTTHASSQDQAIAGYYQGLGGVREKGMYPDTRSYVRSVKAHMARF